MQAAAGRPALRLPGSPPSLPPTAGLLRREDYRLLAAAAVSLPAATTKFSRVSYGNFVMVQTGLSLVVSYDILQGGRPATGPE